jgi:hypothetical protein
MSECVHFRCWHIASVSAVQRYVRSWDAGRSLDISFWANSDIGATMYAYVHPSGFDALV